MTENKIPTRKEIAIRMRELTNNEFCANVESASALVAQYVNGKRKVPQKYINIFIQACGCKNIEEVNKIFPSMNEGNEYNIELSVTNNPVLVTSAQMLELLRITKTLKSFGFVIETKILP